MAKTIKKETNPRKGKENFVGFSKWEQGAMKERIRELNAGKENDERAVLANIAGMAESDRTIAKKLHSLIKANAPVLSPKLWYGMPAYANKEGKVVIYFQTARRFKSRYATLGFSDKAHLDEGNIWPVVYALPKLTTAEEARIAELVKKAVS